VASGSFYQNINIEGALQEFNQHVLSYNKDFKDSIIRQAHN